MNRMSFRAPEEHSRDERGRDERGPAFVPEPLYRERPTPATGLAIALVGGVMMWAAAAVVVRWWWRL